MGKHWTDRLARVFRRYWLFAGIYMKGPFEEWVREQTDDPLTEEDWAAWRA